MENQTKKSHTHWWAWTIIGAVLVIVVLAYLSGQSQNNSQTQDSQTNSPTNTTFYVNGEVNVRKCAAITCDSYGRYSFTGGFDLAYKNLNDLPDWVEVNFKNNSTGENIDGYISKSLFSLSQTTAPVVQNPTPAPVQQPAPEDNGSCKLKAEGVLNSSWIRTCNLRGQLTYQCQQLFDSDGYHKNFPQVGDPNFSAKFGQILNDITACECQLPPDIVYQLKSTQQSSNNSCDIWYPK